MTRIEQTALAGYLPYVLRQADQTLSAPLYAVLQAQGVARSEWRVLAVLAEVGEVGVLELAELALSPQPTVTHALRRLEERNLIKRTQGKQDKRQRWVTITPAGSALTSKLFAEARRLERIALADVDGLADLVAQLQALTESVQASFEQHRLDAEAAS